jgi:hypothetical protein
MRLLSYCLKTVSVQAGGAGLRDVQREPKESPMRNLLIATAAALVAGAPAAAETSQQQPRTLDNNASQQRAGTDDNAGERRICVTERLSGSRMPRRVCRTAREWRALDDGSEDR